MCAISMPSLYPSKSLDPLHWKEPQEIEIHLKPIKICNGKFP